jgi:hypothetical protein
MRFAAIQKFDRPGDLWRGLRVRIGIDTGLGRIRVDRARRELDYDGDVATVSSRLVAAADGGQILATDATLQAAQREIGVSSDATFRVQVASGGGGGASGPHNAGRRLVTSPRSARISGAGLVGGIVDACARLWPAGSVVVPLGGVRVPAVVPHMDDASEESDAEEVFVYQLLPWVLSARRFGPLRRRLVRRGGVAVNGDTLGRESEGSKGPHSKPNPTGSANNGGWQHGTHRGNVGPSVGVGSGQGGGTVGPNAGGGCTRDDGPPQYLGSGETVLNMAAAPPCTPYFGGTEESDATSTIGAILLPPSDVSSVPRALAYARDRGSHFLDPDKFSSSEFSDDTPNARRPQWDAASTTTSGAGAALAVLATPLNPVHPMANEASPVFTRLTQTPLAHDAPRAAAMVGAGGDPSTCIEMMVVARPAASPVNVRVEAGGPGTGINTHHHHRSDALPHQPGGGGGCCAAVTLPTVAFPLPQQPQEEEEARPAVVAGVAAVTTAELSATGAEAPALRRLVMPPPPVVFSCPATPFDDHGHNPPLASFASKS